MAFFVSAGAHAAATGAAPKVGLPKVGLIVSGQALGPAQNVAAEMVSFGFEPRLIALDELAWTGPSQAIAQVRARTAEGLERARKAFLEMKCGDARALISAAERQGQAWAGEPQVAATLVELALVAAECADRSGFKRAARAGEIVLDPARWSPHTRTEYQKALAEEKASAKAKMLFEVAGQTPPASVFVDGRQLGLAPVRAVLSPGPHTLYVLAPGMAPFSKILQGSEVRVEVALEPVAAAEHPGVLRLRIEAGAPSAPDELSEAAARLGVDLVLVASSTPRGVEASGGGPAFRPFAWTHSSSSSAPPLRALLQGLVGHLATTCRFEHLAPERGQAGRPLILSARAAACFERVHGAFRSQRSTAFVSVDAQMQADGRAELVVPARLLPTSSRPYALEYRLWADTRNRPFAAQFGSEATPLHIVIEASSAPRKWYQKWWVWTIVGAAATVAAVVPAVVLTVPPAPGEVVFVGACPMPPCRSDQ